MEKKSITGAQEAAELVATTLENDQKIAATIEAMIKNALADNPACLTGSYLGEQILTKIVGERLVPGGRPGKYMGQIPQNSPQALLWLSLVGFVDWSHVGRYFINRRDDV